MRCVELEGESGNIAVQILPLHEKEGKSAEGQMATHQVASLMSAERE